MGETYNCTSTSETDVLGFAYITTTPSVTLNFCPDNSHISLAKPIKTITDYVCPYCGTRYISDKAGFIPNCNNCGARLEKENEE